MVQGVALYQSVDMQPLPYDQNVLLASVYWAR